MSRFIQLLLLAAVVFAVSCQRDRRDWANACEASDDRHVCAVPFEYLYAHRGMLVGQNIRLEGVLIAGVRPEPPGSKAPVVLLFSSTERARICNPEFAIELVAPSGEISNQLASAGGRLVTVVGRLQSSRKGHWAELEIKSAPTLISSGKEDFDCMAAPPPLLPEPE